MLASDPITGSELLYRETGEIYLTLPREVNADTSVVFISHNNQDSVYYTHERLCWSAKLDGDGNETPGTFNRIACNRVTASYANYSTIEYQVLEFDPAYITKIVRKTLPVTPDAVTVDIDLTGEGLTDISQCMIIETYTNTQYRYTDFVNFRSDLVDTNTLRLTKGGASNWYPFRIEFQIIQFAPGTLTSKQRVSATILTDSVSADQSITAVDLTRSVVTYPQGFQGPSYSGNAYDRNKAAGYLTSPTNVRFTRRAVGGNGDVNCSLIVYEFAASTGITVERLSGVCERAESVSPIAIGRTLSSKSTPFVQSNASNTGMAQSELTILYSHSQVDVALQLNTGLDQLLVTRGDSNSARDRACDVWAEIIEWATGTPPEPPTDAQNALYVLG